MAGSARYWLNIFSPTTWHEFVAAGASVSGFRPGSARLAAKLRPGDWLLCYVTRVSRFVAVLEVTSGVYVDQTPLWSEEAFPYRVRVRSIAMRPLDEGIDIHDLIMSFTRQSTAASPKSWQGHVQNTLRQWKAEDAQLVLARLRSGSGSHPQG